MIAYLVLLLAVVSRIIPLQTHAWNFTAVGGSLLYFGARRSRWQTAIAVLVLAVTDFCLTRYAYSYPFHVRGYLITWAWYAGVCLLGHGLLSRRSQRAPRRRSRLHLGHILLRHQQPRRVDGLHSLPAHLCRYHRVLHHRSSLLRKRSGLHRPASPARSSACRSWPASLPTPTATAATPPPHRFSFTQNKRHSLAGVPFHLHCNPLVLSAEPTASSLLLCCCCFILLPAETRCVAALVEHLPHHINDDTPG